MKTKEEEAIGMKKTGKSHGDRKMVMVNHYDIYLKYLNG